MKTGKIPKILGIITLAIIAIGVIFSIIGWFFINSSVIRGVLFRDIASFLIYFGLLIISLVFGVLAVKKERLWLGIVGLIFSLIYAFIAIVISLSKFVLMY